MALVGRSWLVLAFGAALIGCAGALPPDPAPPRPVQISGRAPGPACRLVEAVAVETGRGDRPSQEILRDYAESRGADYVLLDGFTVWNEADDTPVTVTARLYACPCLAAR